MLCHLLCVYCVFFFVLKMQYHSLLPHYPCIKSDSFALDHNSLLPQQFLSQEIFNTPTHGAGRVKCYLTCMDFGLSELETSFCVKINPKNAITQSPWSETLNEYAHI
eukprot:TRINITY_DN167189_c0_g1_i1.p1 TRINITY_DN167189_c0_g1~~TRINITY_DN167189_c0_g1_i1.p1  ORF type:complete len:107 (+),score=5.32 TRINITY_DN167189_c0_g1_i1:19-339(+)